MLFLSEWGDDQEKIVAQYAAESSKPEINTLASFAMVNAETNPKTCSQQNIKDYPTVIFYKNGYPTQNLQKPSINEVVELIKKQPTGDDDEWEEE